MIRAITEASFEWVKLLLADLEQQSESLYAAKIKEKIEKDVKSWTSKLDPKPYIKLYVGKVYQNQDLLNTFNNS